MYPDRFYCDTGGILETFTTFSIGKVSSPLCVCVSQFGKVSSPLCVCVSQKGSSPLLCVCVSQKVSSPLLCVCVSQKISSPLLPARASEQGNVIGLVSVYIYMYTL